MTAPHHSPNFYEVFSLSQSASQTEIKTAYHRALLHFHPDKNHKVNSTKADDLNILDTHPGTTTDPIPISLIKEAYHTLSTPDLRARHDALLLQKGQPPGPRPAQVVSLEDFQEDPDPRDDSESEGGPWRYKCRCGGTYTITSTEMENGHHLVGCNGCSEVVWVGFELYDLKDGGKLLYYGSYGVVDRLLIRLKVNYTRLNDMTIASCYSSCTGVGDHVPRAPVTAIFLKPLF